MKIWWHLLKEKILKIRLHKTLRHFHDVLYRFENMTCSKLTVVLFIILQLSSCLSFTLVSINVSPLSSSHTSTAIDAIEAASVESLTTNNEEEGSRYVRTLKDLQKLRNFFFKPFYASEQWSMVFDLIDFSINSSYTYAVSIIETTFAFMTMM